MVAGMAAMWRGATVKASARGASGLAFAPSDREKAQRPGGPAEMNDQGMTDDTLKGYRESIDNIDAALVFLLAERFKVTQAVGRYKATSGLPPADPEREAMQIERLRSLAKSANLDPDFSEKFLRFIIDEVIRHHEKVRAAG
jgi:chorismate mutase